MAGTSNQGRGWLVRHALRSAVKRGDPAALDVLGFRGTEAQVLRVAIDPERPHIGGSVRTTRTHYPGNHRVEVIVNGSPHPAGSFQLA